MDIRDPDAVDEDVRRGNFAIGPKIRLAGEGDQFVEIAVGLEAGGGIVLGLFEKDGAGRGEIGRSSIAGHADAADKKSIFVKRDSTGRIVEAAQRKERRANAR